MSSFETDFPSMNEAVSKDALMVSKQVIQAYCLDKSKVKEAFSKIKGLLNDYAIEQFEKELGYPQ